MAAHFTLFKLITLVFSCFYYSTLVKAQANYSLAYANDFVDPDWFLKKEFGAHTSKAQVSVLAWAKDLAAKGPWSASLNFFLTIEKTDDGWRRYG